MRKLAIDLGIEEFEVDNGKVLRFNPADVNLFNRFCAAQQDILQVEQEMVAKAQAIGNDATGETAISILAEADGKMKQILNKIFGCGNDFDDIFEGVNVMAVGINGERVITNFMAVIEPILQEGAQKAARKTAKQDAARIRKNLQGRGKKV